MNTDSRTDSGAAVGSSALFDVGLTDAQRELLALLLEELGESQQAIGKILRHGYESRHPNGGPTNRETLNAEIGDVMAAVEMLHAAGDLSLDVIFRFCGEKKKRVGKYLHFANTSNEKLTV